MQLAADEEKNCNNPTGIVYQVLNADCNNHGSDAKYAAIALVFRSCI
jgi:hypothetical protein